MLDLHICSCFTLQIIVFENFDEYVVKTVGFQLLQLRQQSICFIVLL